MEPSTCRNSIQLKVMSCKDLRAFNFFQKLSVYAIVSIVSDDPHQRLDPLQQQQQQRTPADKEGDGNPEWNHVMEFNLIEGFDLSSLFFHFDLRAEGLVFGIGDRALGEVRVPLDDLILPESNGIVRFVCYQVRSGDGKPNGVLNFSYKAVMNGMGKMGEMGCSCSSPSPANEITGFPILNQPTTLPLNLYPPIESESPSIPQQTLYPSLSSSGSIQHPHYQPYHHPPPPPPPPPHGYYPPPPPPRPPLFPPPPPYHQHPPHGVYSWGPNPYWGRFDG